MVERSRLDLEVTREMMSVTEKDFRKMMGRFTTGVAIVTTHHEGKPVGVTINTLTSVSLDPPLVLFCLGQKRMAFPAFSRSPHCAIHILSAEQQDLCRAFARSSANPWGHLAYELSSTGCPVLTESLGILHCRQATTFPGGDHEIFLYHVEAIQEGCAALNAPLIYYQGTFQ